MQKIAKNEVFKYFIDFEWLYRSDIACFDCIKWSSRIIHGIPRVQHNKVSMTKIIYAKKR